MQDQNSLHKIKKVVENHVGQRVKLKANKSRKRTFEREGVIESTYPSIFVISIDEGRRSPRKVSFCYSDILTKTVELTLCKDDSIIQYG
ncbi:Veg family protein [Garciella nitratireducens]|nr:Veg family protein [Garciella nitratireducens]